MRCPRCNSENSDDRVACWNCFAQLQTATDGKLRKIEPAKDKPAESAPRETQEPTVVETATADVLPQEQTEEPAVLDTAFAEPEAVEAEVSVTEADFLQPAVIETVPETTEPEPVMTEETASTEEIEPQRLVIDEPIPVETADVEQEEQEAGVLNLDESVDESMYIVPGLAEPEPEADETAELDDHDRPVFDLDAFKDEIGDAGDEDEDMDEDTR